MFQSENTRGSDLKKARIDGSLDENHIPNPTSSAPVSPTRVKQRKALTSLTPSAGLASSSSELPVENFLVSRINLASSVDPQSLPTVDAIGAGTGAVISNPVKREMVVFGEEVSDFLDRLMGQMNLTRVSDGFRGLEKVLLAMFGDNAEEDPSLKGCFFGVTEKSVKALLGMKREDNKIFLELTAEQILEAVELLRVYSESIRVLRTLKGSVEFKQAVEMDVSKLVPALSKAREEYQSLSKGRIKELAEKRGKKEELDTELKQLESEVLLLGNLVRDQGFLENLLGGSRNAQLKTEKEIRIRKINEQELPNVKKEIKTLETKNRELSLEFNTKKTQNYSMCFINGKLPNFLQVVLGFDLSSTDRILSYYRDHPSTAMLVISDATKIDELQQTEFASSLHNYLSSADVLISILDDGHRKVVGLRQERQRLEENRTRESEIVMLMQRLELLQRERAEEERQKAEQKVEPSPLLKHAAADPTPTRARVNSFADDKSSTAVAQKPANQQTSTYTATAYEESIDDSHVIHNLSAINAIPLNESDADDLDRPLFEQLKEKTDALVYVQEELVKAEEKVRELTEELELVTKGKSTAERSEEDLRKSLEEAKRIEEETRRKTALVRDELLVLQQSQVAALEKLKELEGEKERRVLADLRAEHAEGQIDELKRQIQVLQFQALEYQKQIAHLQGLLKDAELKLQQAERRSEELQNQLEVAEASLKKSEERSNKLQEQLQVAQTALQQSEVLVKELQAQLAAKESELKVALESQARALDLQEKANKALESAKLAEKEALSAVASASEKGTAETEKAIIALKQLEEAKVQVLAAEELKKIAETEVNAAKSQVAEAEKLKLEAEQKAQAAELKTAEAQQLATKAAEEAKAATEEVAAAKLKTEAASKLHQEALKNVEEERKTKEEALSKLEEAKKTIVEKDKIIAEQKEALKKALEERDKALLGADLSVRLFEYVRDKEKFAHGLNADRDKAFKDTGELYDSLMALYDAFQESLAAEVTLALNKLKEETTKIGSSSSSSSSSLEGTASSSSSTQSLIDKIAVPEIKKQMLTAFTDSVRQMAEAAKIKSELELAEKREKAAQLEKAEKERLEKAAAKEREDILRRAQMDGF